MRITKTEILELRAQKLKKEEIAEKLGLSMPEYRKALKVFNIVSRAKVRNIEFVDDTAETTVPSEAPAA